MTDRLGCRDRNLCSREYLNFQYRQYCEDSAPRCWPSLDINRDVSLAAHFEFLGHFFCNKFAIDPVFQIIATASLNFNPGFKYDVETHWQVKLVMAQTDEDLAFLMGHDTDRYGVSLFFLQCLCSISFFSLLKQFEWLQFQSVGSWTDSLHQDAPCEC
jgi:hypothetical protein